MLLTDNVWSQWTVVYSVHVSVSVSTFIWPHCSDGQCTWFTVCHCWCRCAVLVCAGKWQLTVNWVSTETYSLSCLYVLVQSWICRRHRRHLMSMTAFRWFSDHSHSVMRFKRWLLNRWKWIHCQLPMPFTHMLLEVIPLTMIFYHREIYVCLQMSDHSSVYPDLTLIW